ncbi:AMP-binding protein, partial [Mycobacterium simiae]
MPEAVTRSPTEFHQLLVAERANVMIQTPTAFDALLRVQPEHGPQPPLNAVVLGGEACPADLVDRCRVPGRLLINQYGPSETTMYV